MRLSNRKSYLRYGNEGSAPRKIKLSVRVSRYLYLVFLACALSYGLLYLYKKLFIVEGVGIVQLQSIEIRAEDDMRINSLYVNEGDEVLRQQLILRASSIDNDNRTNVYVGSKESDASDKITRSLELNKLNLQHLYRELNYTKNEKSRLEQLGTLEWNVKRDIILAERRIASLNSEIIKIQGENEILNQQFKSDEISLSRPGNDFFDNGNARNFTISSPIQAQVLRILKKEDEIALKGETLIMLSALTQISIKGFFELKEMEKLRPGKKVDIIFPDGHTGLGEIEKFYYSTLPLPEEFQNNWEPTKRQLVVDIHPTDPEAKDWIQLHRVPVRLRIY